MPKEIEPSVQMRLYTLSKRSLAIVFIIFLCAFSISVIVGLAGPQVVYTDTSTKPVEKDAWNSVRFSLAPSLQLNAFNQQLWLTVTPIPKSQGPESINFKVKPVVKVFYDDNTVYGKDKTEQSDRFNHERLITCEKQICKSIVLLHLGCIEHSDYRVMVELGGMENVDYIESMKFEFKTYKTAFTQLELWFRVTFLVMTFIVTICYSRSLKPYMWKDWSIEQKWMMFLLPLLMLYNNPLFALDFLVTDSAPSVIDGIFQATFLSVLLLYWLCIYHSLRQLKRKFLTFYLPKVILVMLIWLSAVVLSTWQAIIERDDASFNIKIDVVNFTGFKVFLLVLAALYTLCFLYYLIRAFIELRNLAYFDLRFKFTTLFIVVVFSVSITVLVLRFGSGILEENFVSEISTRYGSAAEFLSFYGLLNFYIYTMAYVYSPSKNALIESRFHDNPIVTMLNESDEDVMYGSEREDNYKPLNTRKLSADSD